MNTEKKDLRWIAVSKECHKQMKRYAVEIEASLREVVELAFEFSVTNDLDAFHDFLKEMIRMRKEIKEAEKVTA